MMLSVGSFSLVVLVPEHFQGGEGLHLGVS